LLPALQTNFPHQNLYLLKSIFPSAETFRRMIFSQKTFSIFVNFGEKKMTAFLQFCSSWKKYFNTVPSHFLLRIFFSLSVLTHLKDKKFGTSWIALFNYAKLVILRTSLCILMIFWLIHSTFFSQAPFLSVILFVLHCILNRDVHIDHSLYIVYMFQVLHSMVGFWPHPQTLD
jgi:hypothetical protein